MAIFAYSSLGRGLFSGRITRDNYEEVADGACRTAYCHEVNFQRLDRATELAEKKGTTVPQLAMAYILKQPLNVFAIVGAASREECQANVAALEIDLSPDELAWLDLRMA
jgi:aryl-alcohol dehydrogenase-like predicted oxidoreductase